MDNNAKIGVDMLNVGKADALFIELRDSNDAPYVFLIDAGNISNGKAVAVHANKFFNGNIDTVISTHSDIDHIGGLEEVFNSCNSISHLILNDPRDYIEQEHLIKLAQNKLEAEQTKLYKSALDRMDTLKKVAQGKGAQIWSFFASQNKILAWGGWNCYIVSPSEDLFVNLWANEELIKEWFEESQNLLSQFTYDTNLLDEDIDTTPVNNTSIVLFIEGHNHKYLFTGDAGKLALREATGVKDLSNLNWLDVPHHGSRRNLDNNLISHFSPHVSYISSPGTDKHPRKTVIKALQKVNSRVYSTCKTKNSLYHQNNLPDRIGYSTASPWEIL